MTRVVKMTLELVYTAKDDALVTASKVLTDVARDVMAIPAVAAGQVYTMIGNAPDFKQYGVDVDWALSVTQEHT